MFENGPSDRMQFVGMGGLTHPGVCMVCGNGTCEEGYVRLGVYFEYEGEMFLCVTCVIQAGEIIKMLTPDEAKALWETASNTQAHNVTLETELEKANERLAAYDSVLSGIGGLSGTDLTDDSSSISQESELSNSVDAHSANGPATKQSESPESITESGRSDISKSESSDGSSNISPAGITL